MPKVTVDAAPDDLDPSPHNLDAGEQVASIGGRSPRALLVSAKDRGSAQRTKAYT